MKVTRYFVIIWIIKIGEQSGEYFGAALASLDIDGDGLDELIVGSPLFTSPSSASKLSVGYEEGRITIFTENKIDQQFRMVFSDFGNTNQGRFGTAIARYLLTPCFFSNSFFLSSEKKNN